MAKAATEKSPGIVVEKPTPQKLEQLGVKGWLIFEKDASIFGCHYYEPEVCYILAGRAKVTPTGGVPVTFAAGDLVTFPAGLDCIWEITEPIRKHARLA